MNPSFIRSLDDADLTLEDGGGKGTSLAALRRAGFPVPGGFVVTTRAYRTFVASNELGAMLHEPAGHVSPDDIEALETLSRNIRAKFAAGVMPPAVASAILSSYAAMGEPRVAVRSSATTEDLPELSFAGQQDTFLNIEHRDELLNAVIRCWSSLWTARAIGYRVRNNVPDDGAALAVVVQAMVQSETAGVLFTADPLTGNRRQTVIDVASGLGEAFVSGTIDPDHYVVDAANERIVGRTERGEALLPDEAILALAALGSRAARMFGSPQDIEWAWADNTVYLLQSRPITTLFPMPEGINAEPLRVMISLGAVQGMLDPFTPMGSDLFRVGASRVSAAVSASTRDAPTLLVTAGERLFINVTGALRNAHTRPVVRQALQMVEPGIARILEPLLDDPRLAVTSTPMRLGLLVRAAPLVARVVGRVCYNAMWPDAGRERIQCTIAHEVGAFRSRAAEAKDLPTRLALADSLFASVTRFGPMLMPGLVVGLGSLRLLHVVTAGLVDAEQHVLETTRGLPHNVTTEMDLALWHAAGVIRADQESSRQFAHGDIDALAEQLQAGALAPVAQAAIADFLSRFGMRGVAEIDLGRPRWSEDPRLLLQVLRSYLEIDDPERAPDAMFRKGAASAENTIALLAQRVRSTPYGWCKAAIVRWAGRRVRALAGLRESPKFTVIRLLGTFREALLQSGRELVTRGVLAQPDDLFFLKLGEARTLLADDQRRSRELIAERRATNTREMRRRQVPLLLLSDGVASFAGARGAGDATSADLSGTPVSAGIAEGVVHVIRDPHGVRLAPGAILVCPGTDPAWTPLFLAAGGLVTEVGGLMTHGSVVAREYGIPAVVGVPDATTRLTTGQRIRVDGTNGTITIISEPTTPE